LETKAGVLVAEPEAGLGEFGVVGKEIGRMKHLSVALIFWLSIWTAPNAAPGFSAWGYRAFVIVWGFYLCRKILTEDRQD
jgi:hypothetical protein